MVMRHIKRGKDEVFSILKTIRERKFEGNRGLVIKNGIYQFSTSIVAKIGSILFTIIIARMLMPELFGLYSLALSTIVLFSSFSDLGIGQTFVMFLSRELGKKKGNALGYYKYLLRMKVLLTIVVSSLLAISAYFIANYYYHKPIFFALLAGAIYIISVGLLGFFSLVFQADNEFKPGLIKEAIFQVLRLIFVPIAILFAMKYSDEITLLWVFISLSLAYLLSWVYLYLKRPYYKGHSLTNVQRKAVNSSVVLLTATILSGVFFGYIDSIILGRYVQSQYIGFYQAAMALVGSTGALIGFGGVLFPIFSRLKGDQLKRGLKKSIKITFVASLITVVIALLLANFVILLVYGQAYILSANLLKLLLLLVLIDPLIGMYSVFHISQGRQKFVAKWIVFATFLNIILNILFIKFLLQYSDYAATFGAGLATIISRGIYLGILSWKKN